MSRSPLCRGLPVPAAAVLAMAIAACAPTAPPDTAAIPDNGAPPADGAAAEDGAVPSADLPPALAGTSWQLVEIQSMSDEIGTALPEDRGDYTLTLAADGSIAMALDCNRATGTWTASAASDDSGSFRFGPLAMTRALCPPPSLDDRIAGDAQYVRGYLLRDGRLALSLMADGGIYIWEPLP